MPYIDYNQIQKIRNSYLGNILKNYHTAKIQKSKFISHQNVEILIQINALSQKIQFFAMQHDLPTA